MDHTEVRQGSYFLTLKIFFLAISGAMIAVSIVTSLRSNLFEEFGGLVAQPWVAATLIDFYFNIAIISMWVIYKEKRPFSAAAWVLSFVLLGSITTAFYVWVQLAKLKPGQGLDAVLLRNA